jgi:hypothetical protein
MKGDALSVVAGAGGDDAALALGLRQSEQLVESAALFEGAGSLQIFELEVERETGELRKMVRELARGDVYGVADACAGCLYGR